MLVRTVNEVRRPVSGSGSPTACHHEAAQSQQTHTRSTGKRDQSRVAVYAAVVDERLTAIIIEALNVDADSQNATEKRSDGISSGLASLERPNDGNLFARINAVGLGWGIGLGEESSKLVEVDEALIATG